MYYLALLIEPDPPPEAPSRVPPPGPLQRGWPRTLPKPCAGAPPPTLPGPSAGGLHEGRIEFKVYPTFGVADQILAVTLHSDF